MERPGAKGTLVHFRCENPAHDGPGGRPSDTVTLVEGLWAYCRYDVRAGDHDWRPTGGVPLGSLQHGDRSLGQPAEHDARRG